MNNHKQGIDVITEAEFRRFENPEFYREIAEYPRAFPKRKIISLQIVDTENRSRKAIILFEEK